jgi:hypothetical protein
MKIINLQAENILKLKAIDITPSDSVVYVTGTNGAGKSSILDCITMALCGGREIPKEPIRKGADKGKIIMDIGEYIITRSFTKENSYLKIEAKDGSKVKSPQSLLDSIVGAVSFDPLEFMNNDDKKQREILLALVGANTDDLDKREKQLRDVERPAIGKYRTKAEVTMKASVYHPEVANLAEQSLSDIMTEMEVAQTFNRTLADRETANETIKSNAVKLREQIIEREKDIMLREEQIVRLREEIKDMSQQNMDANKLILEARDAYTAEKEALALIQPRDIESIKSRMGALEETNTKIRENVKYLAAKVDFKSADDDYNAATKEIEDIMAKRQDLIKKMNMPVPGLSFDENGLFYNSIPLAQCSDGEKLMISMGISMALNPTLKVLRIKDGSLLDEKNRAIIAESVKEKGYQLWFESVGSSSSVGILIDEGEIVKLDGAPVEKKAPAEKREYVPKVKGTPVHGESAPSAPGTSAPAQEETNVPSTELPPPAVPDLNW